MRRLILLALAAAACGGAQSRETNPYSLGDPEALARGKQLYAYYCVFCHGMDGLSGRGAQLASRYRKHGTGDREQYRTIADGVPGTEMSGHWLEEDEIWKILLFVRQLEAGAARSRPACDATGNAARGRALFEGKGGCQGCHRAASRLGPDLKGVGQSRSRAHLRESLLDPAKEVSRAWRLVDVKPKNGAPVRGLLLNQDEYTLHLLDTAEQLRSFSRDGLAAIEFPRASLMPSYARSLSSAELDDVLAYLCQGAAQ